MSRYNIGKIIATSLLGSSLALNGAMPGIVAFAEEPATGQVVVDAQAADASAEDGQTASDQVEGAVEEVPVISDVTVQEEAPATSDPVAETAGEDPASEQTAGAEEDAAPVEGGEVPADPSVAGEAAVEGPAAEEPAAAQGAEPASPELSAAEALSFVYVEQPSVDPSGVQNVAFILSDTSAEVLSLIHI